MVAHCDLDLNQVSLELQAQCFYQPIYIVIPKLGIVSGTCAYSESSVA